MARKWRAVALEVDESTTAAAGRTHESYLVAALCGTLVLQRVFILDQTRPYVESSQEVQIALLHSSHPVEGPSPQILQRAVVVRLEHASPSGSSTQF